MMTLIESAGWGIYPVLAWGLGMMGTACVYAIVPKPQFLPLLAAFVVSTLLSGAMGTLRGIQTVVAFAHRSGGGTGTVIELLPDTLLCLQVAIGITFLAMILTLVGAARYASRGPAPQQAAKS